MLVLGELYRPPDVEGQIARRLPEREQALDCRELPSAGARLARELVGPAAHVRQRHLAQGDSGMREEAVDVALVGLLGQRAMVGQPEGDEILVGVGAGTVVGRTRQ